jgi:hypothetical protein
LNGLIKNIFSYVHIILEEEIFYEFFVSMLKKLETLDLPLMTWKKYGGNNVNYCKLNVISNF